MTLLVVSANFCLEPHCQLLAHQYNYFSSAFFGGWRLLSTIFLWRQLYSALLADVACTLESFGYYTQMVSFIMLGRKQKITIFKNVNSSNAIKLVIVVSNLCNYKMNIIHQLYALSK
jgi:hypothetical protein